MTDTNQKDPFDIQPNEDGMYEIELDDEVIARLETLRIDPNETYDDILGRLLDVYDKKTGIDSNSAINN